MGRMPGLGLGAWSEGRWGEFPTMRGVVWGMGLREDEESQKDGKRVPS